MDVAEIDVQQIAQTRGLTGSHLVVTPVNGAFFVMMQTAAPPTDDRAARRAIAVAIDQRAIAAVTFGRLPPAYSFLPPTFPWHRDQVRPSARRYPSSLHVTIAMQPDRETWLPVMLQEQLRHHGIQADIKPYPAAMFNAPQGPLRSGRYTLALAQWIGGGDPEQSVFFACSQRGQDGNNAMAYCNPGFDALFADQSVTPSGARRRADFVAMQRLIARDVPVVPLVYEANFDVVRDRVSGFARNMLMYPVAPERWNAR